MKVSSYRCQLCVLFLVIVTSAQDTVDQCLSNPCLNLGTCTDGDNQFSCSCVAGFAGIRCEININECSSYPCQNGGTCVDLVNSYSCACPVPYAGTRCETAPSYRLVPGPHYGRVETLYQGSWGTASVDGFGKEEADVLCRSLGYTGGIGSFHSADMYGVGSGEIWLSGLSCTGNENSLEECPPKIWGGHTSATHASDAAVFCYGSTSSLLSHGWYGRVMQYVGTTLNSICDTGFDDNEANVICKERGYDGGKAFCCKTFHGYTSFTYGDLACTGSESSLGACSHSTTCSGGIDRAASVVCYKNSITYTSTVSLQSSNNYGTVLITYYNVPGTICDDNWTVEDATVACKIAGYQHGYPVFTGQISNSLDTPIWLKDVQCGGTEGSLTACSVGAWGGHGVTCDHKQDAGVICYDTDDTTAYRLTSSYYGRAEAHKFGRWGKTCVDNWDDNQAKVFCKEKGFSTGYASSWKQAPWPTFVKDFSCTGTEGSLSQCGGSFGATSRCTDATRSAVAYCTQDTQVLDACPAGWKVFNNTCYLFHTTGPKDWTQAHDHCNNLNAELVSFGSEEEKTWVMSTMLATANSGYMIGLSDQDHHGYFIWLDGTANWLANTIPWGSGEPTGATHCVEARTTNLLHVIACTGVTRNFVCEKKRDDVSFRFGGKGVNFGPVEAAIAGHWGSVCRTYWDSTHAQRLCQELGYTGWKAYAYTQFETPYRPFRYTMDHGCGRPPSRHDHPLSACNHYGYGWNYCGSQYSSKAASAVCFNHDADQTLTFSTIGHNPRFYEYLDMNVENRNFIIIECKICNDMHVGLAEFWGEQTNIYEIVISGWGNTQSAIRGELGTDQRAVASTSGFVNCNQFRTFWFGWYNNKLEVGQGETYGENRFLFHQDQQPRPISYVAVNSFTIAGNWKIRLPDCPHGYYPGPLSTNACYKFVTQAASHQDAQRDCWHDNADLVTYASDVERLWAEARMRDNGGGWWHIGMSYLGNEKGDFQWVDGTAMVDSILKWESNEPNGDGACIRTLSDSNDANAMLSDCVCSDLLKYTCKKPRGNTQRLFVYRWGDIRSPGYPLSDYPVSVTYNWYIRVPKERHVALKFARISLEGTNGACTKDYVEVRDGHDSNAAIIGKYCGDVMIPLIRSSSNKLWVKFVSDGDTTSEGFAASIVAECGVGYERSVWTKTADLSSLSGKDFMVRTASSVADCQMACDKDYTCYSVYFDSANAMCYMQLRGLAGMRVQLGGVSLEKYEHECQACSRLWTSSTGYYTTHLLDSRDQMTLDDCKQWCQDTPSCQSIDYLDGNQRCYLRYGSLATGGALNTNAAYVHYETSCEAVTVRLQDGGTWYGRVEVFNNATNTWGTICQTYFTNKEADVVCRQLGFFGGRRNEKFDSSIPVYLDHVDCTGAETSIEQCMYHGSRLVQFRHSDWTVLGACSDAAVYCWQEKGPEFRLVPGPNYGRLELAIDENWGTICWSHFNWHEARMICRNMGYIDGHVITEIDAYGQGSGRIYMRGPICTGSEASILDCPFYHEGMKENACGGNHALDVAIFCFVSTSNSAVLYGHFGRVEFWINGVYNHRRPVCDGSFDDTDATVVCSERGFDSGHAVCCGSSSPWGHSSSKSNWQCTGSESYLLDCTHTDSHCSHYHSAAVLCYQSSITYANEWKLSRGNWGFLQVKYKNAWGIVCDDDWTMNDAMVLCGAKGFDSAIPYGNGGLGREWGPRIFWIQNPVCNGNEASIFECTLGSIGGGYFPTCDHMVGGVGVYCYDSGTVSSYSFRLADRTSTYGRLEVNTLGEWGAVGADPNLSPTSLANLAVVACKSVGLENGTVVFGNPVGYPWRPIWFYNVTCTGSEASLDECQRAPMSEAAHWDRRLDVSMVCWNNANPPDITISLSNGYYGRVYIQYGSDHAGIICQDGWDDADATVLCRTLGYYGGVASGLPRRTYSYWRPIFMTKVECTGNEASIFDCPWSISADPDLCYLGDHRTPAGVVCFDSAESSVIEYRLTDGHPYRGRMEMSMNYVWGTVCIHIDSSHIDIYCQQVGFDDGQMYTDGQGTGPIWMRTYHSCTESNIHDCNRYGYGFTHCNHGQDAGFDCRRNVDQVCDKPRLFKGEAGFFRTPGNPFEVYGNDLQCEYNILVPRGYRVALHITDLRIESSVNCANDYLEIRTPGVVQHFCGTDNPGTILSSANQMRVHFVTNSATGDYGVAAYFQSDCAGATMWTLQGNVTSLHGRDFMVRTMENASACQLECDRQNFCNQLFYDSANAKCYMKLLGFVGDNISYSDVQLMRYVKLCISRAWNEQWISHSGRSMNSAFLSTTTDITLDHCKEECRRRPSCVSFDFRSSGGRCRLHSATSGEISLITEAGTNFYEASAPGSCQEIRESQGSRPVTGWYRLRTQTRVIMAFCEMRRYGGGWTLLLATSSRSCSQSTPLLATSGHTPMVRDYSILMHIESLRGKSRTDHVEFFAEDSNPARRWRNWWIVPKTYIEARVRRRHHIGVSAMKTIIAGQIKGLNDGSILSDNNNFHFGEDCSNAVTDTSGRSTIFLWMRSPKQTIFGVRCFYRYCKNGGRCYFYGGQRQCYCSRGIHGDRCQYNDAQFKNLGCWADSTVVGLETLEGTDPRLMDNYQTREDAVYKCYKAAKARGFKVFALKNGGQCLSSASAHLILKRRQERSFTCYINGKGGSHAKQFYQIMPGNKKLSAQYKVQKNIVVENAAALKSVTTKNPMICMGQCTGEAECTGFHFRPMQGDTDTNCQLISTDVAEATQVPHSTLSLYLRIPEGEVEEEDFY